MPWTVDHGPRSGGNWKNGKDCDQVSNAQGVSLDFSGKLILALERGALRRAAKLAMLAV